ncbi:hypothetical protein K2173_011303 [Erythroxylum novogranatense]|uniref:ARM repeat superfamily protein n=1 Tax=Erythroxylum novogranatense TaxID=1862640 RepID=A0AAV8S9D7_9ROSI|nr:hypothetical protein K2173_011303 [Erythroxylum novogranatense]
MVWFMGEFSHMSTDFDNVVSVVLDNYGLQDKEGSVKEDSPPSDSMMRVPSWRMIVNEKGQLNVSLEDSNNPTFWSRVCLNNMAHLAKEATTVRRVLESLFRYFDNEDLWTPEHGLALSVLSDMQSMIEKTGQNMHFVLAILIKHLDHKNVLKKPKMQLDIVDVATCLAKQTKVQASVAIIGALSDMMRHLRKSIHCSLDDSNLGVEVIEWNRRFREAVDECLVQLSSKVGDADPVLDIMAVMLENVPTITVMARTLISAVYRTAQIVASMPNLSYQNKAFPEALFHQLLLAMVYDDHETRAGAHRIFSVVLVPCCVCPRPSAAVVSNKAQNIQRTFSRTVSVFSSSAALFDKLKKKEHSPQTNISEDRKERTVAFQDSKANNPSMLNRLKSSYSRVYTVKRNALPAGTEENPSTNLAQDQRVSLKMSSRQITLLLSSIWAQSLSPLNTPENYEALANTYSLVLLFARTKNSSNDTLIQSFQLAFSLRSFALSGGPLKPSRRRSLFTLATSMIVFSSKAYNINPIVASAKAALTDTIADPFLRLVDDSKLKAVNIELDPLYKVFGSTEDDEEALKLLSAVDISGNQSKESFAAMIVKFLGTPSDQESSLTARLLNDFRPDDACPLGADLFADIRDKNGETGSGKNDHSNKVEPPLFTFEDNVSPDTVEGQTDCNKPLPSNPPNLLSVDDLLNGISETTSQVGRLSASAVPNMPYVDMAKHCADLSAGKQEKMKALMISQQRQESLMKIPAHEHQQRKEITSDSQIEQKGNTHPEQNFNPNYNNPFVTATPTPCGAEYQQYQYFQLPTLSPYDNFLKAAGC